MVQRKRSVEKMGLIELAKKTIEQFERYTPEVAIRNIIYHFITREQRKSFGKENPDKTIYVIRSLAEKSPYYIGPVHNLLANYFYVLSHIQYARQRGWVPVVDQLNYPVYNSQTQPVNGKTNPWEYFWQQPGGISLEEAYQSRDVVLSQQSWFWEWDMGYEPANYTDQDLVAFYHEIAGTVVLNDATKAYVEHVRKSLLPAGETVLGINVRTGGYARQTERHGQGHPIQPELEELAATALQRKAEWGMDKVFLTSDTEYAVAFFQKTFGDALIVYPRQRATLGTEFLPDSKKIIYAPGRSFQTALDYLTEMELLSTCDGLIGAISSGFRYAVVKNGNRYRHIEVIDCGRFDDRRKRNDR